MKEDFIYKVCWYYFVNGMTQSEIAKLLKTTRLQINKTIQYARNNDFVNIKLESPFASCIGLQKQLCDKFNLNNAYVAVSDRINYNYHIPTGTALAYFLEDKISDNNVKSIGLSWGLTLEHAVRKISKSEHSDLEIISILGGTSIGVSFNSFDITSKLAYKLGAKYSLLASPIYLTNGHDKNIFLSEPVFTKHYKKFQTLDVAVILASDISNKSFLVKENLPPGISAKDLIDCGAVGDILGRFINSSGELIDHPINDAAVGIDFKDLPRISDVVLAASGKHKVDIILAAMKRNIINTLVTDDITAELLLQR